jgi:hypothetical protein
LQTILSRSAVFLVHSMTQKPGERVRNPSLQENFQVLVLFAG